LDPFLDPLLGPPWDPPGGPPAGKFPGGRAGGISAPRGAPPAPPARGPKIAKNGPKSAFREKTGSRQENPKKALFRGFSAFPPKSIGANNTKIGRFLGDPPKTPISAYMAKTPEIALPEKNRKTFPGGPPGGAKKCTFFWVFNNSPSRDRILLFWHFWSKSGPPGDPPFWGLFWGSEIWGYYAPPGGSVFIEDG